MSKEPARGIPALVNVEEHMVDNNCSVVKNISTEDLRLLVVLTRLFGMSSMSINMKKLVA